MPQWGASNEYPQHMLPWRNKKKCYVNTPLIWSYDKKAQIIMKSDQGLLCSSTQNYTVCAYVGCEGRGWSGTVLFTYSITELKKQLFFFFFNRKKNWHFSNFYFHIKTCCEYLFETYFLILTQRINCGYSLEVPQWGTSNEYPQCLFFMEIQEKYLSG